MSLITVMSVCRLAFDNPEFQITCNECGERGMISRREYEITSNFIGKRLCRECRSKRCHVVSSWFEGGPQPTMYQRSNFNYLWLPQADLRKAPQLWLQTLRMNPSTREAQSQQCQYNVHYHRCQLRTFHSIQPGCCTYKLYPLIPNQVRYIHHLHHVLIQLVTGNTTC